VSYWDCQHIHLRGDVIVFVDQLEESLGYDHIRKILENIDAVSLRPIIDSTGYFVQASLGVHVLTLANSSIFKKAVNDHSSDINIHPKVTYSAEPGPLLFEYDATPWSPFLLA
jgi:hypothetical protein